MSDGLSGGFGGALIALYFWNTYGPYELWEVLLLLFIFIAGVTSIRKIMEEVTSEVGA